MLYLICSDGSSFGTPIQHYTCFDYAIFLYIARGNSGVIEEYVTSNGNTGCVICRYCTSSTRRGKYHSKHNYADYFRRIVNVIMTVQNNNLFEEYL